MQKDTKEISINWFSPASLVLSNYLLPLSGGLHLVLNMIDSLLSLCSYSLLCISLHQNYPFTPITLYLNTHISRYVIKDTHMAILAHESYPHSLLIQRTYIPPKCPADTVSTKQHIMKILRSTLQIKI